MESKRNTICLAGNSLETQNKMLHANEFSTEINSQKSEDEKFRNSMIFKKLKGQDRGSLIRKVKAKQDSFILNLSSQEVVEKPSWPNRSFRLSMESDVSSKSNNITVNAKTSQNSSIITRSNTRREEGGECCRRCTVF